MDQLELLKKDWKKQESTLPKLSKQELSKLIHKKSSSIVKWIFIISILEFLVPNLILLFTGYDASMKLYKELGLTNFMNIIFLISTIVIFYFIFRFYKNYKSISVNSNSKDLMQNIIKTRKTVRYYIWFSLSIIPLVSVIVLYKTFNSSDFLEKMPEGTNIVLIWLIALVFIAIIVGLFWLFYRLIYGILLSKLKKNYDELASNSLDEL